MSLSTAVSPPLAASPRPVSKIPPAAAASATTPASRRAGVAPDTDDDANAGPSSPLAAAAAASAAAVADAAAQASRRSGPSPSRQLFPGSGAGPGDGAATHTTQTLADSVPLNDAARGMAPVSPRVRRDDTVHTRVSATAPPPAPQTHAQGTGTPSASLRTPARRILSKTGTPTSIASPSPTSAAHAAGGSSAARHPIPASYGSVLQSTGSTDYSNSNYHQNLNQIQNQNQQQYSNQQQCPNQSGADGSLTSNLGDGIGSNNLGIGNGGVGNITGGNSTGPTDPNAPRQPLSSLSVSRTYALDPIVRVVNDARITRYFYGGVTERQLDDALGPVDYTELEKIVKTEVDTNYQKVSDASATTTIADSTAAIPATTTVNTTTTGATVATSSAPPSATASSPSAVPQATSEKTVDGSKNDEQGTNVKAEEITNSVDDVSAGEASKANPEPSVNAQPETVINELASDVKTDGVENEKNGKSNPLNIHTKQKDHPQTDHSAFLVTNTAPKSSSLKRQSLKYPGQFETRPSHIGPIIRAKTIFNEVTYTGAYFAPDAPVKTRDTLRLFLLPQFTSKDIGSIVPVIIPAHCLLAHKNLAVRSRAIWGTEIYTDDSDIVAILIHTGNFIPFPPSEIQNAKESFEVGMPFTDGSGMVSIGEALSPPTISCLIRVLPKLTKYTGTLRYGLQSRGWGGSHDGYSIRVEKVWCDSPDATVSSTWLRSNWKNQYFDFLLLDRMDRLAKWKETKAEEFKKALPAVAEPTQQNKVAEQSPDTTARILKETDKDTVTTVVVNKEQITTEDDKEDDEELPDSPSPKKVKR